MSISELQNEIESWDESFASAINYLESVIVHAEVVDSSLKELVENYGKVEQEVNVRVRTLKDLMLKDLNYEELENFFEKSRYGLLDFVNGGRGLVLCGL
ncbi:unnamed protein product [Enterobius vermicularis]|uniref:PCRF domain-containing protein n=1 Tax=Enterobius vermicularis TaxID=51028 RepID=A0A0N4VJM5_ENTVE|nr:unnamed protein product [Enterobius vermicularis]